MCLFEPGLVLTFVVLFSREGLCVGMGAERTGKDRKSEDEDANSGVYGNSAGEEFSFSFRFRAFEGTSELPLVLRDC